MKRYDSDVVTASFRKCTSFDAEKEIMLSDDIPLLLEGIGYDANSEQIEIYTKWWTQVYGGVLPLDLVCTLFGMADNIPKLLESLVCCCDFDKNGFVSEDEFKASVQFVLVHDPDFPRVNYNEFLQQADKNLDGKVSIAEAVEWFVKNQNIRKNL